MPTTLSEMIAQQLDAEPDEIEAELRLYLRELSSGIRSGAYHEIDGFGTFESLNGELHFKPTELLLRAVNFRFEKLEPYQVAGEEVAAEQEIATVQETIVESVKDPVPIVREEKRQRDRPAVPLDEEKKHRRPFKPARILLLIVPLVVVAAVIAGLIYSDRLFVSSGPDASLSAPQEVVSESDQAALPPRDVPAASDANASEISRTESTIDEQQAAPEEVASTLQSDPDNISLDSDPAVTGSEQPAGFTSDFDRSAQGYTLMIGWKGRVDLAEDAIAAYQNLGLPRAVLAYQAEGITRFRMAIGQYESIEAAQLALEQLGNRIPTDSYILRIR